MYDMITMYAMGNLTNKKKKDLKNNDEFLRWYYILLNFALDRFVFSGIPDSCDEKTIKESLVYRGGFVLFKEDTSKGILSLPCQPSSKLNIYGYSQEVNAYGMNGFNKTIAVNLENETDENKGFYIKEFKRGLPMIHYVMGYAEKIADCMRTLDIMRFHLKRPYIITASEEVVPTVKKYFDNVKSNEEFIISSGVFDSSKVDSIDIQQSDSAITNVRELIEWYLNQFKEICGISSSPQTDKKERLLVDEVHANDESTEFTVHGIVDYIQYQLDFANIAYGTNIRIELNEQSEVSDSELDSLFDEKGDSDNEKVQ